MLKWFPLPKKTHSYSLLSVKKMSQVSFPWRPSVPVSSPRPPPPPSNFICSKARQWQWGRGITICFFADQIISICFFCFGFRNFFYSLETVKLAKQSSHSDETVSAKESVGDGHVGYVRGSSGPSFPGGAKESSRSPSLELYFCIFGWLTVRFLLSLSLSLSLCPPSLLLCGGPVISCLEMGELWSGGISRYSLCVPARQHQALDQVYASPIQTKSSISLTHSILQGHFWPQIYLF